VVNGKFVEKAVMGVYETHEIIIPTNLASEVIVKVAEYFRAGSRAVWVVYPIEELVYAYGSPTSVKVLSRSDQLEAPDLLPGFLLPLESLLETAEPPD
jgi:Uma2 family endonuclease